MLLTLMCRRRYDGRPLMTASGSLISAETPDPNPQRLATGTETRRESTPEPRSNVP